MRDGRLSERRLWVAAGGSGERLLVLLHGLGANATVWTRVIELIEAGGGVRWIAPDLRGHGRSAQEGPYGYAAHAADIAHLVGDEDPALVTVVGHSFGGVIGATLATGWFGVLPRAVAAIGVKLEWTAEEVAKAQEMAKRPARPLPARAEAIERSLKMAGLHGLMDPASELAGVGIREEGDGFKVALDPRVFGAVGPSLAQIFGLAQCSLRLAAGANDPMVSLEAMRRIDPQAVQFAGAGHNAHWESPAEVLRFALGV